MGRGYQSKTGRVRGVVFRAIRSLAAQGRAFTAHDVIALRPMKWTSAVIACHELTHRRELECVTPGRAGRFGSRTPVFRATKNLRPAELTGKSL